jgi:hypothetical protein
MLNVRSVFKLNKRSLPVRISAYTLAIVFFIVIGFITGRASPNKCNSSVLGAQTSSNSLLSNLALLLKVNPEIQTQQLNATQIIITPSPTPKSQWPTFPTTTPTATPKSQWPTPPTPTATPKSQWPTFPTTTPTATPKSQWPTPPTPTPLAYQWPSPTPTSAPITPDKIKQIVNGAGITLTNTEATMSLNTNSYTIKGNVQDKILGLIQISYPATLSVDGNGGMTESIAKPWWQKIFINPFTNLVSCTSLTGETSCIKNGCSYWSECGKCEDVTTPYVPACSCYATKNKGSCDSSASCEWHSECAGGGACAAIGASSKISCGGCLNVNGEDACNKEGSGCGFDSNCGRCEDPYVPDPTCTCASVKSKSACSAAASCEWHSECAGGGACAALLTSSKVACGGCGNVVGENACNKEGSYCGFDSNCGRCEDPYVPDPTCTCDSDKTKSACDSAASCSWHSECAGGGACASLLANSEVACGGCGNILNKSACNKAGCVYSNNQCQ